MTAILPRVEQFRGQERNTLKRQGYLFMPRQKCQEFRQDGATRARGRSARGRLFSDIDILVPRAAPANAEATLDGLTILILVVVARVVHTLHRENPLLTAADSEPN